MNETLCQAIRGRRRIRFSYHGRPRLVEPQCHGHNAKHNELLRGYQLEGGEAPEPLYRVDEIRELVVLDETFDRPGPHYRKNDSAMTVIYCQL